jgi:sortase (surface protein transpeptidase)
MGLGVASAVCLVVWAAHWAPSTGADSAAVGNPTSNVASATATSPPDQATPRITRRPVELDIPAIDVSTRLTGLGLQADGTVQVPTDPGLAGWYQPGTVPGAVGSAVILGHVDSMQGPAVFYRLSSLHPGDAIQVRLNDGTTTHFVVHSINVYPNADFPDRLVYGGHGRRELNLVTCGGTYDASLGGYQANVVVNARRT